jgi:hypothetical protein
MYVAVGVHRRLSAISLFAAAIHAIVVLRRRTYALGGAGFNPSGSSPPVTQRTSRAPRG